MKEASIYLECAFVLGVTGAAMIAPPLALIVAAAFLTVLGVVFWLSARPAPPAPDGGES